MSAVEKRGNFNKQHSLPCLQVFSPVIYANSCGASSKIQHEKISMSHKSLEQKSKHVAVKKKTHRSAMDLITLQTNRQETKIIFINCIKQSRILD